MSNQRQSLLKNTLIYTIGNIGSKIFSFLLLPIFSYYLSKSDLGTYDLIITTVNLFVPFVTLQVSDATYRWIIDAQGNKELQQKAVSNGMLMMLISSTTFYSIYFTLSFFIKFQFTVYFALMLLTSCYLPFFQQIIRGLGKNKLYAYTGMASALLISILAVLLLIVFKKGMIGLFWGSIISNAFTIVLTLILARIPQYLNFKSVNLRTIKEMVAYSWPMIPNVISWWLISAADRYIILYFLHSEANGIYAISTRFPTIVSVINSVFMLAWQDHAIMSKDDNIDNTFITDVFHRFVKFELSIVIFLISVSQFVVIHLIDKKFVDSWHYMPFLYLAVAFASFSAFVGVGHQKAKKTFGIFTTTIIGAILNIVISIALIKHIGLYATGIGSFISFAAVYLIRLHQAKNYFEIKVDHKMLWSLTGLSIIITIINLTGNRVMILACIGISVILMIWLNKYFIDKGLAFIGKMGRNKIALRT